jgi:hypothetical protein
MKRFYGTLVALGLVLATGNAFAADATGLYGNSAAKADQDLTIPDMLTYAIQDEYLARAEYTAIMAKFGTARPFSNIREAESTHIAWLNDAFADYSLPVPADQGAAHVVLPAALKQAFETGVQAEVDNIALYDRFLASPLFKDAQHSDLKAVFENLKRGSENHLRAFRNQLSRY